MYIILSLNKHDDRSGSTTTLSAHCMFRQLWRSHCQRRLKDQAATAAVLQNDSTIKTRYKARSSECGQIGLEDALPVKRAR